jgi:hypothetical protein
MGSLLLVLALVLPTGTTRGRNVDCTSHSTWSTPDGWTLVRAGSETLAIAPGKHAVLVRTAVASDRGRAVKTRAAGARAIAARIAGVELTWDEPVVTKRNKYDHTTTIDGHGTDVAVRVVQRDRGFGKDIVWVEIAEGADRDAAFATMDKARGGERQLVDHACVCGTDCDSDR